MKLMHGGIKRTMFLSFEKLINFILKFSKSSTATIFSSPYANSETSIT